MKSRSTKRTCGIDATLSGLGDFFGAFSQGSSCLATRGLSDGILSGFTEPCHATQSCPPNRDRLIPTAAQWLVKRRPTPHLALLPIGWGEGGRRPGEGFTFVPPVCSQSWYYAKVVPESQRDSILQPKVARHELPWENRAYPPTLKGLQQERTASKEWLTDLLQPLQG